MDAGGCYATYEVITVDLKTREISEAVDVLYAVILPGVAALRYFIVLIAHYSSPWTSHLC